MGQLFIKWIALISFAVTGLFSFYLVIINFLEHLEHVSRAMLFFQLGCAIVLAATGAVMFWRLRLSSIIAIVCLVGLASLFMNFKAEPDTGDAISTLQHYFPLAYCISCVAAVVLLFLKPEEED